MKVLCLSSLSLLLALACDTSGAIVPLNDAGIRDAAVLDGPQPIVDAAAACDPSARCQADEYCEYEGGVCGDTVSNGRCAPRPDACTDEVAPACGCDGVTYDNPCLAWTAGTDIVAMGACPEESCGDDACVACTVDEVPEKKNQCECPTCERYPTPASVCDAKEAAFADVCAQVLMNCPEPTGCSDPQVMCTSDGICASQPAP